MSLCPLSLNTAPATLPCCDPRDSDFRCPERHLRPDERKQARGLSTKNVKVRG